MNCYIEVKWAGGDGGEHFRSERKTLARALVPEGEIEALLESKG